MSGQLAVQKGAKLRPDLATIVGLTIAVASIAGGLILDGGKIADVGQVTAAIIVLGGTIGAVLVSTPLPLFLAALKRLGNVVTTHGQPLAASLDTILHFAERARRNGLSSLEDEAGTIADPYLKKVMNLAIDGIDLREVRQIMELQMIEEEERAEAEAKVWESAAGYSPTIGIIGAVLGLIQVMKHLDNLDEVGKGIAVAFVATVYGVACANLIFLPAAAKLKTRDAEHSKLRQMMLEGVISIAEGLNPRLIAIKLEPFVGSGRSAGGDQPGRRSEDNRGPVKVTSNAKAS